MLKSLEKRNDGYELFEITSIDDLDLTSLTSMIDQAWLADYRDESRIDWNETVLRKIMAGDSWTGVLACSSDGEPVGFELALERTLRVQGETLRVYYVSALTVAADHRRKGLGQLVLRGINRLVFEKFEGDLILSTFHEGHAGSPAVQATFDKIPDWGVSRFHQAPIFGLRLVDASGDSLHEAIPSFVQLVAPQSVAGQLTAGPLSHGTVELPTDRELDTLIRSDFEISFALERSLRTQYLNPDNLASGIFYYQPSTDTNCLLAWNILPMMMNERHLQPIGQLQLLLAKKGPGSASGIEQAVRHLAHFLAGRGCFAMTYLDTGSVPREVLDRVGFVLSEDVVTFAARGPQRTLEVFEGTEPPYFIDFT